MEQPSFYCISFYLKLELFQVGSIKTSLHSKLITSMATHFYFLSKKCFVGLHIFTLTLSCFLYCKDKFHRSAKQNTLMCKYLKSWILPSSLNQQKHSCPVVTHPHEKCCHSSVQHIWQILLHNFSQFLMNY